MSIESALRELGKEIQKDERFVALQVAAKANEQTNHSSSKCRRCSLSLLNISRRLKKERKHHQDRIKELQDDLQKLYTEIMAGENMQNYSAAASEMEKMAQYISGMIGLFFDGQDAETCELPAQDACTHNCSTCGGCH